MDPIWLVPVAVCIPIIVWKATDAIRLLNSKEHLQIMGIYVTADYLLYGVIYHLGLGISERLAGAAWISGHTLVVHLVIIISFISSFLFLVYRVQRTVKRVGPPTIEKISNQVNNTTRMVERVAERLSDTNKRVTEYRDKCQKKYEEVKKDVEKKYEKENERIDALDGVVNDHEKTMKDNAEKMRRIGDQMEKQAEAVKDLKDEVESLRGKKGEEEGHEWEDEVAQRFVKFGYGVEINPDKGPDIVVRDSPSGQPLFVVGAKAYKLRSRRGLSDKFSPEVDRAKTAEAPLVVAVKNKLNDLELFNIFKPGELENFTCSAPTWLVGEEATDEGKENERECRRALKDLLLRSSVE